VTGLRARGGAGSNVLDELATAFQGSEHRNLPRLLLHSGHKSEALKLPKFQIRAGSVRESMPALPRCVVPPVD